MVDVRIDESMKVRLIYPIESAHGSLTKDYYIRTLNNGKQIVARKPHREGHVKTEQEAANQRLFASRYARRSAHVTDTD